MDNHSVANFTISLPEPFHLAMVTLYPLINRTDDRFIVQMKAAKDDNWTDIIRGHLPYILDRRALEIQISDEWEREGDGGAVTTQFLRFLAYSNETGVGLDLIEVFGLRRWR